ncbi:MAG: hypothetical protein COA84_12615 [Robiginitomaculum sp.]|nr:MAG: hypothetical protein COA84_12615 [Robiginitomaculum sp.]
MTLNDIYLASQVLAVFALVPSVVYLAVQVRQNTLQARANAAYQFLEANGSINIAVIESKQVASVIRRGLEGYDSLDKDEKLQFMWFIGQHFTVHNTMYALYQNKMLPESQWHPVKKDILTMMLTPGSRTVWDDIAVEGLSPDFVAYVEALLASGEGSYSLGKLFELHEEEQ